MATYRKSRSIEASFVDYITDELDDAGWTGITVQKTYKKITELTLPIIVVNVRDTSHERVETGSHTTWRRPIVTIEIFGTDDGNRLDLKDFLISILKGGLPFYDYTTATANRNTTVDTKVANGRISVDTIDEAPVDYDTDKSELATIDRYKHLITIGCSLSKVDA